MWTGKKKTLKNKDWGDGCVTGNVKAATVFSFHSSHKGGGLGTSALGEFLCSFPESGPFKMRKDRPLEVRPKREELLMRYTSRGIWELKKKPTKNPPNLRGDNCKFCKGGGALLRQVN